MREKKQKLADNERDLERRQNESTTRLQQLKKELEVINNVLINKQLLSNLSCTMLCQRLTPVSYICVNSG